MSTRSIPCRVCGKMFVPCNKTSSELGAFNYRGVACSPECGVEYFRRVQDARKKSSDPLDAIVSTEEEKTEGRDLTVKHTRGQRRSINLAEEKVEGE